MSSPVSDTIILNTSGPSSAVSPMALCQSTAAFTVTWSGSALGFGLASYDVQYKDGATGQWTDWMTSTLATSAVFTGTEGHTYYFQSRAKDLDSNLESYPGGDRGTRTTVDLTPLTGGRGAKAQVTPVPAVEPEQESTLGTLKSTGKFLTLTAKAGETNVTTVSKRYAITVGYTAAEVSGIDESTLGIYWWNGSAWQKEPTSAVDTAARTVSATLDHLSAFAVLGEGWKVYIPLAVKSYGAGW